MKRTVAAAVALHMVTLLPAHAEAPLIVIDRWWGVDDAKVVCKIPAFKPAGKSEAAASRKERRATTYLN